MKPVIMLCGILMSLYAHAALAQDILSEPREPAPIELVERGIESSWVELTVSGSEVLAVDFRPCHGCDMVRHLPSRDIELYVGRQVITADMADTLPDGPGTVFVNSDSNMVTKVRLSNIKRGEDQ